MNTPARACYIEGVRKAMVTIAGFLAHTCTYDSLLRLYSVSRSWRDVCKPIIENFHKECDKRVYYRDGCRTSSSDDSAVVAIRYVASFDEYGRLHRHDDSPAYSDDSGFFWYRHGKLHRDGGRPAIMRMHGFREANPALVTHEWYVHGIRHRDNGPAQITADGTSIWMCQGRIHRDNDKPAIVHADGSSVWYKHGQIHREGNHPAVIHADVHEWYYCGVRHRDGDLPAVVCADGTREWWYLGDRHRICNTLSIARRCDNGIFTLGNVAAPAVIHADGSYEYWMDGRIVYP
jgi:hypothetical protein